MHRPLSPFERAIWRLSEAATFNFAIVGQVRGKLSVETLNAALQMVQLRHPLLGVGVDEQTGSFHSENVQLLCADTIVDDQRDWRHHVEEEINTPLPCDPGPLMRCRHIRRGGDLHEIILTFHHLVGDGTSGLLLMQDLLVAINWLADGRSGHPWKRLKDTTPIDQRLPRTVCGLRGRWKQCRYILRSLTQDVRIGGPSTLPCESEEPNVPQRLMIQSHQFTPDASATLRRQAKEHRASLHGALSAAIVLATADQIAPGDTVPIKHRMPINMRDKLEPPVGPQSGMFASMMLARVRCNGNDDFWPVARSISRQVKRDRQTDDPVINVRMVPTLFGLIRGDRLSDVQLVKRWRKQLRSATALTNLGKVEIEGSTNKLRLERLQFVASPGPLGDFTCAAMSHKEQLQLNFTFACPNISVTTAKTLASSVEARLASAIDDQTGGRVPRPKAA